MLPPSPTPKASGMIRAKSGKLSSLSLCKPIKILIIIAVNGMLSTKAEPRADSYKCINLVTLLKYAVCIHKVLAQSMQRTVIGNRACGGDALMATFNWSPMYPIKPSSVRHSISTKSAAKNNNVAHSTSCKYLGSA